VASHRIGTNTFVRLQCPLATYLSDLAAPLCGPHRRREAILAELRDGLEQATEERIATKCSIAPPAGRDRR
jgi:hypothetical protein